MNNQQHMPIKTETKVALGILSFTALVIFFGVIAFKSTVGNNTTISQKIDADKAKYIQTDIHADALKVSPKINPKITGVATGTYEGSSTSPIEITEFMDYECPACASGGEPLVEQLLKKYGSRLTITRRIFPVHGIPSIQIAQMVLASQDISNDAYQKLHTKVFETQSQWSILGSGEREVFFKKMTADLGLDYDSLVKVGASKYTSQIDQDKADALALSIQATPSFIINNTTRVTGAVPIAYIDEYVDVR